MELNSYSIEDFVGKVVSNIKFERAGKYNQGPIDAIIFNFADGDIFKIYHEQECCESVFLKDITGDLDFLINEKILKIEEISNQEGEMYSTETWTFHRISTFNNTISLCWYGESNGFHSEGVNVAKFVCGKFETYR